MKFITCFLAVAVCFASVSAQAAEDITTGLISAYNFDAGSGTTVEDVVGANNGTVSGTEFSTTSKNGTYSMDFSGGTTRDHVSLGNMDIPGSACTIMMWFNTRGFVSGTQNHDERLLSKNLTTGTGTQDHVWMISGWRNNNLRFRLKTGTTVGAGTVEVLTGAVAPGVFVNDTWTHVACIYDGANLSIYVNGELKGTPVAQSGEIYQDAAIPARLGDTAAETPATPLTYDGFIDDVRIYSRALNAAEITEAMNTPVGPAEPAPGIQVLDGATVVPNGGTVDLGKPAKDEVVSKTITLKNTGDLQLTLAPPVMTGAYTVSASDPLEATVEAGLDTTFTVDLDTSAEGVKDGTATIATNVTGADPFVINLTADVGNTEVKDWSDR